MPFNFSYRIYKTLFLFVFIMCTGLIATNNFTSVEELQPDYRLHKVRALNATVDYFNSLFLTQYGPIRWKQIQWKWDPDHEAELAKIKLNSLSQIYIDSIKPAFNQLLGSTRDGHVSIFYHDKRAAIIPLQTYLIEGKVIVTHSELPEIKVGDEITHVENQKVLDYLCKALYNASWDELPLVRPQYDLRRLFTRLGHIDAIPDVTKPLTITICRGEKSLKTELEWLYIPNTDWYLKGNDEDDMRAESTGQPIPLIASIMNEKANEYRVPHYREFDFLENLAFQQQLSNEKNKHNPTVPHWYIKEVNGQRIGYFRLPDFSNRQVIQVLDEAIPFFKKKTDALLIDMRNNPGGISFLCMAVLSRLSDKPLVNLLESRIIDEETVLSSRSLCQALECLLQQARSDEDIHECVGQDNFLGYYITADLLRDMLHSHKAIIEEWENGYSCTRFTPHAGISLIEPHPYLFYKKPIFVLINEKDGSCGDFFPAVLRDNGRATLIGRTTAGLGGCVKDFKIPNFVGIEQFRLTHSLLLRNNQLPIEDIGVAPHYERALNLEELLHPELELDRAFQFAASQLETKVAK